MVCARKQGSDLGYSTEAKFSGTRMVCFVQKGVGNEYTPFHFVFFHGGCLERMYEAGRTKPSMGGDLSEQCVGILVEILFTLKVKNSTVTFYLGDLVG